MRRKETNPNLDCAEHYTKATAITVQKKVDREFDSWATNLHKDDEKLEPDQIAVFDLITKETDKDFPINMDEMFDQELTMTAYENKRNNF